MTKYSCEQDFGVEKAHLAGEAAAQLEPLKWPLLMLLPGESLYSYMARHHQLWAHQRAVETIRAFFGTATGRSLIEGLRPVDVLAWRTGGCLGDAQQIYHERTHLRFYELFLLDRDMRLLEPGQETQNSTLKFPMALWSGRIVDSHPLKACQRCMQQDFEEFGVTYWKLEHQYPGVWICLDHDCGLQETTRRRKPSERFFWQVPSQHALEPTLSCFSDAKVFAKAKAMASLIRDATVAQSGSNMIAEYRPRLCDFLRARGLLSDAGKLKISQPTDLAGICSNFIAYVEEIRPLPNYFALPSSAHEVRAMLSKFLAGRRMANPIEVFALMMWTDAQMPASQTAS